MVRNRKLALSSLLFAAACSSGSPPIPGTPAPPDDSAGATPEQTAVSLGMSVMSSTAAGAPRLLRAIVPRAAAAGMAPAQAARDHVAALAPLWVRQAPAMALTENGSQQLRNGATVVKLAQQVDGVVVHHGELRVLMHADGSLAAVSGTLLPAVAKPSFVATPRQALASALDDLFGKGRAQPAITETGDRSGWHQLAVAAGTGLQITQARARRELSSVGGQLTPVWSVELFGEGPADPRLDASIPIPMGRRYLVGDGDLRVVSNANLMKSDAFVYRAFAEPTGIRRPFDGVLESFAPHPTGIPDGSEPGFTGSNLVVMDAFNRTLDKWLPNDATHASGNNVDAFADLDGTATFTAGDLRAEVRAGRTLNYRYDVTAEPLATPTQSKAAIVNAFFLTNWMHDWWYDSGFTEATGNAQVDNYGRGGIGGDPITVFAQFGANVGQRNNAFMGTPADGASPQMLMLLWTQGTRPFLAGPAGRVRSENVGAEPRVFELTGEVIAVADAVAPTGDACQAVGNDLTGKIALVTFSGACGSRVTVDNVKAAGAIGVILADGVLDNPRPFAGSAAAAIPTLAIGRPDGVALEAALAAGPVTVTLRSEISGPERDGDFDNGVVAHEWGHYLHQRLAVCDSGQQCGAMSEGWGDFNALLMMLREGDRREGTYAMGGFAVADGTPDAAYFGIRRFPYSIDRTRNDLSLRHISDGVPLPTTTPGGGGLASSEVHDAGEIWASQLWEAFHVLIDAHDVAVARRRMSDYVVAGLLLTPPEASFTEGRDAILAAASALDSDDMLLMAAAFAGRGAGSCAVTPPGNSADNAGVIESGTLAARLELGTLSLIDDAISCDQDGYLDPGESGVLRVTLANSGVVDAESVSITATASVAGVKIGPAIRIPAMRPFTSATLTFPVSLPASLPPNTNVTFSVRATGDFTCARNGTTIPLDVATGLDEVVGASRLDTVEARQTPWALTGDQAVSLWSRPAEVSGNHTWFGRNAGFPSDTQLMSPAVSVSPTEPFVVKLAHAYALEGFGPVLFDGGVVEVSTDDGASWADVTTFGVDPGYTGALILGGGNPLEGRPAFSGASPGFPARAPLVLDFGTQLAGQTVRLRFRIGTDRNTAALGWIIDDIEVSGAINTPFTAVVPETAVCRARATASQDSSVVATLAAPATSLQAFDAAVCIASDAP
jgi:large repetitive protein